MSTPVGVVHHKLVIGLRVTETLVALDYKAYIHTIGHPETNQYKTYVESHFNGEKL
jgi:hypothetical protein